MTLYFHSQNEFPIDAVSMIGLSAKVTDHPIGQFGTGLKYAIAVILRNGGSIELSSGTKLYSFDTKPDNFREQSYEAIWMHSSEGSQKLPFTLNYGKDWELWMAYRELFSNCLDEGGGVTTSQPTARTIFTITGMDMIHQAHEKIFCDTKAEVLYEDETIAIYNKPSESLFFLGIRVLDFDNEVKYTYNLKSKVVLSEDRYLKHPYEAMVYYGRAIIGTMPERTIRRLIEDEKGTKFFENWTSYISQKPSTAFICGAKNCAFTPMRYLEYIRKQMPMEDVIEEVTLSAFHEKELLHACRFVTKLFPAFDRSEVKVSRTLQNDLLGVYLPRTGEIWIGMATFDEGFDSLCATLLEEALHKHKGFMDETREFQEYLLKKVISLAKQVL